MFTVASAAGAAEQNVMRINTKHHGKEYDRSNSCVLEVRYSVVGLYIIVEAYPVADETPLHVEYFFSVDRGFRLLDEGDLGLYWKSGAFASNYLLFEVESGGWLTPQESGCNFPQVTSAMPEYREWVIVTANECVSVFAPKPPSVRELAP